MRVLSWRWNVSEWKEKFSLALALAWSAVQGVWRLMGRKGRKGYLVKVFPTPQWRAEIPHMELIGEKMRWEKWKAQMINLWMTSGLSEKHSPNWWWSAIGGISYPWLENRFVVPEYCKNQHTDLCHGSAVTGGGGGSAPGNAPTIHGSHCLVFPFGQKKQLQVCYRWE